MKMLKRSIKKYFLRKIIASSLKEHHEMKLQLLLVVRLNLC